MTTTSFAGPIPFAGPTGGDPTDIFMWRRIDGRLTSSGQPTEAQLAAIRATGVAHILNLGLHSHEQALPDEAASVRSLGMDYGHIPVAFDAPAHADFHAFCAAMERLDGAVINIHCIANLRVSAFLYRYRLEVLGLPEAAARADMEAIWRPGGAWARFIGDAGSAGRPHLYAGRDY